MKKNSSDNNDKTSKYKGLKEKLEENSEWPIKYMYKFIIPNETEKVEKVKEAFGGKANIKTNLSKTGKYISITITTTENNADDIINKYKSLENIEGIVAL